MDGILSIFSDSFNEVIGKIPMNYHPIAEFGSIKTGLYSTGYDYKDTVAECGPEKFYIANVETSKIRDNNLKELNPELNIGFIEFDIKTNRYPRL